MKLLKRKKQKPLEVPEFKFERPEIPMPDVGEWFDSYFSQEEKEAMRQSTLKYIEELQKKGHKEIESN